MTTTQTPRPRRIIQAHADTNGVPPTEAMQPAGTAAHSAPTWAADPRVGEARIIHDSRPQPQTIPCTPWCDSKDTRDESCIGQEHVTTLSLHNRVEWADGQWSDEWASVYSCTNRTHIDPGYIHLGIGEATGMRLTPAEARSIAAALLAAADEMNPA